MVLTLVCTCFFYTTKTLNFYVLFEMSIPPTLFIIVLYGYQPEKLTAASYLVMYTVLSSLPILLVILTLPPYINAIDPRSSFYVILAITLGFMVKTPIYLVHVWLPKAHVEAPVAGSIALAGVLLKLGSYGLMVFLPLYKHTFLSLYLYISVVGGIICCFVCVRQWDAKGLVAYSSVVHIRVVTVGLISGHELGYSCALIIVIGHGVCSPLLFGLAFYLYENSHTRILSINRGNISSPIVVFFLILLLAVNIGVPPFLNVWAEVLIFVVLLKILAWRVPYAVFLAFFGVLYNLAMYVMLTHGKERSAMS